MRMDGIQETEIYPETTEAQIGLIGQNIPDIKVALFQRHIIVMIGKIKHSLGLVVDFPDKGQINSAQIKAVGIMAHIGIITQIGQKITGYADVGLNFQSGPRGWSS